MPGIFISYRREDSIAYAGKLYDRLADQFGEERIFMDIDTMKLGISFVEQLQKAVSDCDVLVAVIGKDWLRITDDEGHLRLDNPKDFVRIEIKTALSRDIPVIPILVGGAAIPNASKLPDDMRNLVERHGMEIRDTQFRDDTQRLIEAVREYVSDRPPGKKWVQIQVNGPEIQGNISQPAQNDLYTFSVVTAGEYSIEISGSTEAFLTLFGPNNDTNLIAQDDDSGHNSLSRTQNSLTVGTYFVSVRHISPGSTGTYGVRVRRV